MVIERFWLRWFVAFLTLVAATGLNVLFQAQLQGRGPLVPYFPMLAIVGLCSGLMPALAVLILSALLVLHLWVPPVGALFPLSKPDTFFLILYVLSGLLIASVSALAGRLMRRESQARERLTRALATGRMVTWEWDRSTGLLSTAGAGQEALGGPWLTVEDLRRSIHKDDLEKFDALYEHAKTSGGRFQLLCRLTRTPTDSVTWAQLDGNIALDAKGRVSQAYGVVVDVTELTKIQEQLRVEGARKDAFLATLAHELRNPMAPIRYAVALLRRVSDEQQKARAVDIITRQSAHMARLLDDLLDMSRITRNAITLQKEVVDLRDVVQQALEAVEPLYAERGHSLSSTFPKEQVLVCVDPTRVQQVMGNLLDNAAKYSPSPGRVEVDVAVHDRAATIAVKDSGIGIPPNKQGSLFELFSRLGNEGSGPPGLGIGLAISKQLIQLHGGTVGALSAGQGQGSTFTVQLPLWHESRAIPQQRAELPRPARRGHLNILVVDDNVDAANTLCEVLAASGFDARCVNSGEAALASYEQAHADVVLLDIGLPDISGLEVAKQLRQRAAGRGLSLVAITGWGQQSDRDATEAAGFDAHLVKPVDFGKLEALLEQLDSAKSAADASW